MRSHALPFFYFHLFNSNNVPDDVGLDLPNLDAAKREALSFAGAILRDEKPIEIWQGQLWRLNVTDSPMIERGRTLLTIDVTASEP
jgi:hypothetical protein